MKKGLAILKYALIGISLLTLLGVFVLTDDYKGVDLILVWAEIMLVFGVAVTLILSAINITKNPKGAKGSLIGVAVVAVVLVIAYLLSDASPLMLSDGEVYTSKLGLYTADMGLYTGYFAMGVALLAVIFGEIRNSFK